MKPFQTIALLFLFSGLSANPNTNLSYGTWVEDSLNISFQYPRAWVKKVERTPYSLILLLEKNKEAVLRLDTQTREKSWDLDRFIEENVDLLLQKHPNMQIMQERKLADNYNGFDAAHFVLIHYKEQGVLITNRFLFTRKANNYYVIQSKIVRSEFSKYKNEADLFMKSVIYERSDSERWRNDSLSYLNPANDEATIRFIKESIRQSKWNIVSDGDRLQGYEPKMETDSSEGRPKRPIKDVEPGKNPPEGSVEPVELDSPGPI
jgi:hypothetical protein